MLYLLCQLRNQGLPDKRNGSVYKADGLNSAVSNVWMSSAERQYRTDDSFNMRVDGS